MEPGAETGHLVGMLFLVGAAYGTFAVIGGGLYLAYRRAVRRRVDRLIASIPGSGARRRDAARGS